MGKSMVRPEEEFGRDFCLVKEAVITGRKVGAGKKFWSALAHNQKLFAEVVKYVQLGGYEPQKLVVEWENFYQRVLGISANLSRVKIPTHQPTSDFSRIVMVAEDLTLNQVWEVCKKRFPTWSYYGDDLDEAVPINNRTTAKSYAIRIRDRQEADEELKNLSANQLNEKGIPGINLLECLLLKLKYHDETGYHLDLRNFTLCNGSRDSNGDVPHVRWKDGRLHVDWSLTTSAYSFLRSRAVIS
ncbi:hypothetical protein GW950_01415 [Candidatus Wolfebacteria bacterium]|nr:hypothetical protein [Candidatus Wolfebacteria bacterium]